MSLPEIADAIKSKVSFYGIFKDHEALELTDYKQELLKEQLKEQTQNIFEYVLESESKLQRSVQKLEK
jgi:hypothetical protein